MATQHGSKRSPEARAAYAEVEKGVRNLGKSIAEIRRGLTKAERKIEADARARIRALRAEAKGQLSGLRSREREATQMLKALRAAAEGSWREVKHSADAMLADARATAASIIERFRAAFGG